MKTSAPLHTIHIEAAAQKHAPSAPVNVCQCRNGECFKHMASVICLNRRQLQERSLSAALHAEQGSSTTKQLPPLFEASTQTRPPCRSAMARTIESPKPAPPNSRKRDLSTRKKGSKTCSRNCGGIPIPSSEISTRICPSSRTASIFTVPLGRLYLIAFSTRLQKARSNNMRFPQTVPG